MTPKILLVNPAVYDFAAFDFWLKPYGLLSVAGYLRGQGQFKLFDHMDRLHRFNKDKNLRTDQWGRGRFYSEKIANPDCHSNIPRYYLRFGLPREIFQQYLSQQEPFDLVFVQTMMTYWYPGVQEVIEDIRHYCPKAKIILGGNYVTLCRQHAERLGADLLISGTDLGPLWGYLGMEPDLGQPALWEAYEKLSVGAIKLTDGCPFKCTYCSVPTVYGRFEARPIERALAELKLMVKCGASNIAFYDDALLFKAQEVVMPFFEKVLQENIKVNFHSPNALNARFITAELAELAVRAGFKMFYLGFESASSKWQKLTGSKVFSDELARAVKHLVSAGAEPTNITAYQIVGHPHCDIQGLAESMRFVNSLGIRGMLADFSPIPGTPDGRAAEKWVDMTEPLMHNKTAFPIILLGNDEVNRLKEIQKQLNQNLIK
ncbi:MAG: B12-binding domain-containing radical SAM protein [Planctomycetota bacterium]|jgi:radical SAM superfamily enzyme YgiQ (UPF0313 family)